VPPDTRTHRRKLFGWSAAVLLVSVLVAGIDYWRRCHGLPLTRAEAVERAQKRMTRFFTSRGFQIPMPELVGTQFEADTNAWLITYKSGAPATSL
jgi:hypothetical protein